MAPRTTIVAKTEPSSLTEVAAPVTESGALLIMIERAARDTTIDIDRMERLVNIHRDMEMRQAEGAFNFAMAQAQAELIPVARNVLNEHTKKKYADLSAISKAAMPFIHKHGFGLTFSEFKSQEPGCMGVMCEVLHSAGFGKPGFTKRYEFNIPLDATGSQGKVNKTNTQTYGSTFQYGRRYATCGVFNIVTEDDLDGNKTPTSSETISAEQEETIRNRITGNPVHDITAFLAHFQIETLSELPASKFKGAMFAMSEREKNLAKEDNA